jgi:hypothetical protein
MNEEKHERTTFGFMQVWLDTENKLCAIISSSFDSSNKAKQKFLSSNSKQIQAAVPGRTL